MALPDFVIIGAMKCGTTTLAAQLGAQDGVFVTDPKEPNFFSDDKMFAKGAAWYQALFKDAAAGDLKGEASTHYAKSPTYPNTIGRLAAVQPDPRIVYMTREPKARLVSQYIHEWTEGIVSCDIDAALDERPELIAYSRYAMQIAPWVERFGRERVLLSSLEAMKRDPEGELARIGAFIGMSTRPTWRAAAEQMNVSAERIRHFPGYRVLVMNPVADAVRRALVPKWIRKKIKGRLQKRERPELSAASHARLDAIFAKDAADMAALIPDSRR